MELIAQPLTSMDGPSERGQVVVTTATGLPNALGPALLRPGRFDLLDETGPPDLAARAEILAARLRAIPLPDDVDPEERAAPCEGWNGMEPEGRRQSASQDRRSEPMSNGRYELVAAMSAEAAGRLPAALGVTVVSEGPRALVLLPAEGRPSLRALVSRKGPQVAAERLVARQRLLEALQEAGDVLPALPGQTLRARALRPALAANGAALAEALAAVAGRAQFQVLIRWDASKALGRFVDEPELVDCGDAIARAFGAEALRARFGAEFARRLAARAVDSLALPLEPGPEMLINLTVLLPRQDARFEAELEAIDAIWPEGFSIRMIGPSPAASFAAFELMPPGSAAAAARRTLGVKARADEAEVRAALRARALAPHEPAAAGAALTEAAELLRRLARGRAAVAAAGLPDPGDRLPLLRVLREGEAPSGAPRREETAA